MLDRREAPNGSLAGRTLILILRRDVEKIGFVEEPSCLIGGSLWFWGQRRDTRLHAIEDLLALEVAAVGEHCQGILADCIVGLMGHR